MSELAVWKGDCDWVVAASEDDAWDAWCSDTGESREDYEDSQVFEREPDEKVLTIWGDEGFDKCDCQVRRKRLRKDVEEKEAMLQKLPERARSILHHGIIRNLPSHPNGHLIGCHIGAEKKTCAEWAASNGRGFLCSTEY